MNLSNVSSGEIICHNVRRFEVRGGGGGLTIQGSSFFACHFYLSFLFACHHTGAPHFTHVDEELAKAFAVYCGISISHVCTTVFVDVFMEVTNAVHRSVEGFGSMSEFYTQLLQASYCFAQSVFISCKHTHACAYAYTN